MTKSALMTGVTGQDGSYLCELLLKKGCIIESAAPDEIYNLAAQSHVKVSFENPENTAEIDAMGVLRLLECVRDYLEHATRRVRVYQAGSSEMFGSAQPPQSETTPFYPRSPYAISKLAAFWHAVNYREAYGLFISNGILFNHESPRRGETFVTRKITRATGRIKAGMPQNFRPTEADHLEGDATKIRTILGWRPTVAFRELVRMMVNADTCLAEEEIAGRFHSVSPLEPERV